MPKIKATAKWIENVRSVTDNSRTHSVVCDLSTPARAVAWFLQEVKFSIPHEKRYRYHYVSLVMGKPFMHILDPYLGEFSGITTKIGWNDQEPLHLVEKAKKIDYSEVLRLRRDRKACACLEETPEGLAMTLRV